MSKTDNLHDYLSDLADAIREKKGSSEPINAQSFAEEIRGIESGNGWTGHADVEGLKAIGWDDDDIAYYQKHGVNWNEEDDQYHLVSDDNKALYGVLTADNIADYKDRIVYLPKIDFAGKGMSSKFSDCKAMVALPMIDTSSATSFYGTFASCFSLRCLPPLNTANVTRFDVAFQSCYNLQFLPPLNLSKVTTFSQWLQNCHSIEVLNEINNDISTNFTQFTGNASSLKHILGVNVEKATTLGGLNALPSLITLKFEGLPRNLDVSASALLSKESLLYIINNEAATEVITITLHSYAYSRLAEDADVVAALANHPLVSLASA